MGARAYLVHPPSQGTTALAVDEWKRILRRSLK